MLLDLSSLHSVKEFTDLYISRGFSLDILVLNAGVFGGSLRYIHIYYMSSTFPTLCYYM